MMYRLLHGQRIKKSSDFDEFRSIRGIRSTGFILKVLPRERINNAKTCALAALEQQQIDAVAENFAPLESKFAQLSFPRVGIITSRKVGNAVKRNRARRVIRETFRLNPKYFEKNCDYLFITNKTITEISSKKVTASILAAAKRLQESHNAENFH